MRVGLVLGAGGIQGGAWLTGGLDALAEETGWDPASADYVVGTSAGSMIGALVAGGIPPWFMVAHSRGEVFEGLVGPDGRPAADADRSAGASFRLHRGVPAIGPGSLRMAFTALSNPLRHTPLQMVAGWVTSGFGSGSGGAGTARPAGVSSVSRTPGGNATRTRSRPPSLASYTAASAAFMRAETSSA